MDMSDPLINVVDRKTSLKWTELKTFEKLFSNICERWITFTRKASLGKNYFDNYSG